MKALSKKSIEALLHELNLQIGRSVKSERKKAKLNQTEISFLIGLDQTAVCRIEAGKQFMTAAQWFLLQNSIAELARTKR